MTAETVMVLPVLVSLALGLVWVLALAATQVRVVDAARETARAAARDDGRASAVALGRRVAPDGATVTLQEDGDSVVVRVRATVRGPQACSPSCRGSTCTPRRSPPRSRDEPGAGSSPDGSAGSAAVLAVVLVAVLATAALLVSSVGGVVADQRRVESAADLAALAAAGAVQAGGDACSAAATSVRRNGGRLAGCSVAGEEVTVRVTRSRLVLGHVVGLSSRARAGPAQRLGGGGVS